MISANFVDLDKFYGALFNFTRNKSELLPNNLDGSQLNPYTDAANSDVWESALSADSRFRSRINAFARAVNMGATYIGLKSVAEAVLSCEVDLVESWTKVDTLNTNNTIVTPVGLGWGQIKAQFTTWGNINVSYGTLTGDQFGQGNTPAGNRGEVVFTPRRLITTEESYQLAQVLRILRPSNVQVTISQQKNQTTTSVPIRNLASDSENWTIQTRVTPALNLATGPEGLYQNAGPYSVARPVFSEFTGETWSYNPNVVKASSYQMQNNSITTTVNDQTIVYQDNTSHTYTALDGLLDARQAVSARLSGDGIVTAFPYAGDRFLFSTG
jgi:hypothetical protein